MEKAQTLNIKCTVCLLTRFLNAAHNHGLILNSYATIQTVVYWRSRTNLLLKKVPSFSISSKCGYLLDWLVPLCLVLKWQNVKTSVKPAMKMSSTASNSSLQTQVSLKAFEFKTYLKTSAWLLLLRLHSWTSICCQRVTVGDHMTAIFWGPSYETLPFFPEQVNAGQQHHSIISMTYCDDITTDRKGETWQNPFVKKLFYENKLKFPLYFFLDTITILIVRTRVLKMKFWWWSHCHFLSISIHIVSVSGQEIQQIWDIAACLLLACSQLHPLRMNVTHGTVKLQSRPIGSASANPDAIMTTDSLY